MKIAKSNSEGFLFTSLPQEKIKLPSDTEKKMNRINILTNPDTFRNLAYLHVNKEEGVIDYKLDILWKKAQEKKNLFTKKKVSSMFNSKFLKVSFGNQKNNKKDQQDFLEFLKIQAYNLSCIKKKERVRVNSMSNAEMLIKIMEDQEEFDIKMECHKRKSQSKVSMQRSSSMVNVRSDLRKFSNPRKIVYQCASSRKVKKFKGEDNFDNYPLTKEMIKKEAQLKQKENKEEIIKQIAKIEQNDITAKIDRKDVDIFISPFIRKRKFEEKYEAIKSRHSNTRPLTSLKRLSSSKVIEMHEKCTEILNKSKCDLKSNTKAIKNDNKEILGTTERMKLGKSYGLIKELRDETMDEEKKNGIFVYGRGHQGYHYTNQDRLFSSVYTMGLTSKTK